MSLLRMFDVNEDVLVVDKNDFNKNCFEREYFLVSKDEWNSEEDGFKTFCLYLTRLEKGRIFLYLTKEGNPVIFRELPLCKRKDYIEI